MRWFLLSFAVIFAAAQSQEPPKPKATEQKSKTEQRDSEKSSLFVKTPSPTTQADRDYEAYEKREKPANERKITDATVALAWITGILAMFTAGLWFATYCLVRDAKKTAERQLRAYVSVDGVNIKPLAPGEPAFVTLAIQNHGDTPASDLDFSGAIEIFSHPLQDNHTFLPEPSWQKIKVTLFPKSAAHSAGAVTNRPLTPEEIAVVSNKASGRRLYVYGMVKYQDAFKKPRQTEFCFSITDIDQMKLPNGRAYFEMARVHNEIE